MITITTTAPMPIAAKSIGSIGGGGVGVVVGVVGVVVVGVVGGVVGSGAAFFIPKSIACLTKYKPVMYSCPAYDDSVIPQ